MDFNKTQFLFEERHFGKTLRTFKRRRKLVLVDGHQKPVRLIDMEEWRDIRTRWPDYVKSYGISVRNVWVLEEVV